MKSVYTIIISIYVATVYDNIKIYTISILDLNLKKKMYTSPKVTNSNESYIRTAGYCNFTNINTSTDPYGLDIMKNQFNKPNSYVVFVYIVILFILNTNNSNFLLPSSCFDTIYYCFKHFSRFRCVLSCFLDYYFTSIHTYITI